MQGKGIFLDPVSTTANPSTRSGSMMWEYASITFTKGKQDSVMTAWGVGIHGFKTESSTLFTDVATVATLEAQAVTVVVMSRRYMTKAGLKTRLYIEGGPSLTTMDFTLRAGGFSASDDGSKFGASGAIGIRHRLSKKVSLLLEGAYHYVNVDGTFDPSAFTATIGLGFGN